MKAAATFFTSLFLCVLLLQSGRAQESGARRSFRVEGVPLRAAVDSLMKWFPESIVYVDADLEGIRVSALCVECNFDEALSKLLAGTSLTWVKVGNQVVLKLQEPQQPDRSGTVMGMVTDSLTGEWIAAASVLLQDSSRSVILRWCPTNDFGFYSLPRLRPGAYALTIRAIGYESAVYPITLGSDGKLRCDAVVIPKDIVMEEVTVEGRRTALTAVQGISRGIYIRSVPTDYNQYLLDGGRVYNPIHFGGVLSTFSPEILNDVIVVGGGLPPSYGGRLGGFVDLSLRDGGRERLSGSAGIGTLGSSLSLGGPLSSSTTFLLSGRGGYPDASMEYLHQGGISSRQRFSEFVGKFAHRLSGSGQISASGYFGSDSYSNQATGLGLKLDNAFSWDNSLVNLRWIGILGPSLFFNVCAAYSQYDFTLDHTLTLDPSLLSVSGLSSDYGIEDFTFRVMAEDYYDEDHTVRGGTEIIHHRLHGTISNFSNQLAPLTLGGFSAWEAAVYLQDQWKLLPGLSAELGARATSFLGDDGSFSAVDPRFSLRMSADEHTVTFCSLSGVSQFMHPYRNTGVFLLYPTVFWYPSGDSVRPSTSLSFSVGGERSFGNDEYTTSLEAYYRVINNFHDFGLDTLPAAPGDLYESILYGKGRTYGFVCTVQKRIGNLTGSVSYNLSWSLESFPQVNGGREFRSPFDRRHEVQISGKYSAGEHWTFGTLCVLATGPSSLIPVRQTGTAGARNLPLATDKFGLVTNASYGEFLDVNGGRLPGFQRLEFSTIYRSVLWGVPCQFSLRLLNSYGLLDPFLWNLQRSGDIRTVWSVELRQPALFPLYPAVGFSVRF